jgi:hypothetical protein
VPIFWLEPTWTAAIPEVLLRSISRYYKVLPASQRGVFLSEITGKAS